MMISPINFSNCQNGIEKINRYQLSKNQVTFKRGTVTATATATATGIKEGLKKSIEGLAALATTAFSFLCVKSCSKKENNDYNIVNQNIESVKVTENDLMNKYPEVAKRFEEKCRYTYYKGDTGTLEDAYPVSVRQEILKTYDADPSEGEKMLEVFYGQKDSTALRYLEKMKDNPLFLDELYADYQQTKDAYVPMKRIEYKRLDTERMNLVDELYQDKLDKTRKEEIINRINEINSLIKGGAVMVKTIENPDNPLETSQSVLLI